MKPVPPELKPPWFQPWVPGWKRALALPMYLYWPYDELPPWEPGEPDEHGNLCAGRMVIWGDSFYRNHEEPLREESVANICETDIVYCPLFAGVDHGPDHKPDQGRGFDDRLPIPVYEHNLALLPEIAQRAKAVLLGNLFGEYTAWEYPNQGTQFEQWQAEVRARRFFWAAAELVREAGGRPAFAPVPYDLRMDLFTGNARMRDMWRQLDALVISFNGDLILEALDEALRSQDPEGWEKVKGCPRWKRVAEYFEPLDFVGGTDWEKINEADWDERAKRHGFKAMC